MRVVSVNEQHDAVTIGMQRVLPPVLIVEQLVNGVEPVLGELKDAPIVVHSRRLKTIRRPNDGVGCGRYL